MNLIDNVVVLTSDRIRFGHEKIESLVILKCLKLILEYITNIFQIGKNFLQVKYNFRSYFQIVNSK